MKIYLGKSFSLNFRHPFDSRGCLKVRLGNFLCIKVVFVMVLACENCECINRTVFVIRRRRKFVDERDFPIQTLNIRIKFNRLSSLGSIVQSAITLIVISILVSFLSA